MFLPACSLWEPIVQMTHKPWRSTVRIPPPWRIWRLGSSHLFLRDNGISAEFLLPFSSRPCAHHQHHHCLPAEHLCLNPVHTCYNQTTLLWSEGCAEQDTLRLRWPGVLGLRHLLNLPVLNFHSLFLWLTTDHWGFKYRKPFVWYHLIMFVSWRALGKTTSCPLSFTKANIHLCLQKTGRITRIAKSMLLPWRPTTQAATVETAFSLRAGPWRECSSKRAISPRLNPVAYTGQDDCSLLSISS